MVHSLKEGKIIGLTEVDTLADGIAIKRAGILPFNIVKDVVEDIVVVDDDEITHAVFMLLERCKQVVEPAGAVGLAALLSGKINVKGKKAGVIISGGNISMSLLSRIIDRSLYKEKRLAKITVIIPDRPGILRDILEIVAKAKANVMTIDHDRVSSHLKPGRTEVTITVEIPQKYYLNELMKMLKETGYPISEIVL
jgi:threonine dehydratase